MAMRLCLTCRYLTGADGAAYCGHCARSFGGRRCPRGHLSPPDAAVCVHCGRQDLSEPTGSLDLGFVPVGISVLLCFGALCLLARHGGTLLGWAGQGLESLFAAVAGRPPGSVFRPLLERLLAWAIVLTALLHLIPGRLGKDVRRGTGRLLGRAWRFVSRLVLLLFSLRQAERIARLLRGGSGGRR